MPKTNLSSVPEIFPSIEITGFKLTFDKLIFLDFQNVLIKSVVLGAVKTLASFLFLLINQESSKIGVFFPRRENDSFDATTFLGTSSEKNFFREKVEDIYLPIQVAYKDEFLFYLFLVNFKYWLSDL